jgi:phosphopantetheine--protein transferase-like protein
MSCLFPQSPDLASFWQNIVQGKDCIREVGPDEWSQETFYQPYSDWRQKESFEKIYCRRGGFVTDTAEFNAMKYGVMPNAVAATDPDQMLALRLACQAIADAGYDKRSFDAAKAEVIMGRTSAPGHGSMNAVQYGVTVAQIVAIVKEVRPDWDKQALLAFAEELRRSLKICVPEAIPGVMPNILAGRIAGKLGFHGKSLVLDAACASSLVAVEMAVNDLRAGLADLVLAGGSFINSFAVFYQLFSRLGALSHGEEIRPFDQNADGTLLGEGVGMVVLKRMSDALRDGDRVYASILGVGSSSDGKGTSMLAPAVEGEALALQRAYDDAGVSPRTVELIEAHGTGTAVGDVAEMQALKKVFAPAATSEQDNNWCALGSIKSMIGHTQAASGIAGLIKTALSLYQKVLPPTLNVIQPNSQIDWNKSPCYINVKARPWVHARPHPLLNAADPQVVDSLPPRRAGVSAFGFGGVNAHVVLEEFDELAEAEHPSLHQDWESEVFCFAGKDRSSLVGELGKLKTQLSENADYKLKDLAYTVNCAARTGEAESEKEQGSIGPRVAFVCSAVDELKEKLEFALSALSSERPMNGVVSNAEQRNIYFSDDSDVAKGKLAFVLPGLGAAYPGMLTELCLHFPEVRQIFDFVDDLAAKSGSGIPPSRKIFPYPDFGLNGFAQSSATLASMDAAVVTVIMAEWAIFTLFLHLEIMPDILVGCSTGEFAALTMSGAADILAASPLFYHLSTSAARSIPQERLAELRSLRVAASYEQVEAHLKSRSDSVYLGANLSEHQILLSGYKTSIEELLKEFDREGIDAVLLPSAIPYHTPLVEGVVDENREEISELEFYAPQIPSWSCSTASFYPPDSDALKKITTQLFTVPIQFRRSIELLYQEGVRKFVEVGPKDALTSVVSEILADKPHLAVASNRASYSAISQLNQMLAALFANGVSMNLDYLYRRRETKQIDLTSEHKVATTAKRALLNLRYPEVRLLEGWQERTGLNASGPTSIGQGSGQVGYAVAGEEDSEELGPVSGQESVVSSYLGAMASFHSHLMRVQEEVMATYLNGQTSFENGAGPPFVTAVERFPLMRGACFQTTDDTISIELLLDLTNHRYLVDHAIGGVVRTIYQSGERVHLLPLTVAIELMAEAASHFHPGLKVDCISDIRAYKRIRVGAEGTRVEILARRMNDASVSVEICRMRDLVKNENEQLNQERDLLMACRVTFAAELISSNQTADAVSGRAPRLVPSALYGSHAMFHGPRMQSVISLTSVADREISGRVSGRMPTDWFGEPPEEYDANLLLNPLLLDNATQLVLFHLFEHGEEADALLPFMVESIKLYADLGAVSETLTVKAVLDSITQRNTKADVLLFDNDKKLVAEFRSISSRRIVLDERWRRFVARPDTSFLGTKQDLDFKAMLEGQAITLHSVDESILPEDEGALSWCADYLLSPWETQVFDALSPANRRREWLLGRIAAKEAVRQLVLKTLGNKLCSADIEIYSDGHGKPFVADFTCGDEKLAMHVSITHKNGMAIAVALQSSKAKGVGIDLEAVSPKEAGFEDLVLTGSEKTRFANKLADRRDLVLAKIWSAKEAVSKAIGSGLSGNPKSLEIIQANETLDEFEVASAAKLALAGDYGRKESKSETVTARCLTLDKSVLTLAILH